MTDDTMLRNMSNLSVFIFWLSKADWSQRGGFCGVILCDYLGFEITISMGNNNMIFVHRGGREVMSMKLNPEVWR